MKLVAVTMLEQSMPDRREERDAIDRRWAALLERCGLWPIFLPNVPEAARGLLCSLPLSGAILTGGGTANGSWTTPSPRDLVELEIEACSAARRFPILGVCRGMQALMAWDGIQPSAVSGHVGMPHRLDIGERTVNSYHEFGFRGDVGEYTVRARAADGTIEWIVDPNRRRMGIMWHPEREHPFVEDDIRLIRDWFNHD